MQVRVGLPQQHSCQLRMSVVTNTVWCLLQNFREQRTGIGEYSFVNRTTKLWSQLSAEALATVTCKSHTFRKRVRKVIISEKWKIFEGSWRNVQKCRDVKKIKTLVRGHKGRGVEWSHESLKRPSIKTVLDLRVPSNAMCLGCKRLHAWGFRSTWKSHCVTAHLQLHTLKMDAQRFFETSVTRRYIP
jgi:hypothetical protein